MYIYVAESTKHVHNTLVTFPPFYTQTYKRTATPSVSKPWRTTCRWLIYVESAATFRPFTAWLNYSKTVQEQDLTITADACAIKKILCHFIHTPSLNPKAFRFTDCPK